MTGMRTAAVILAQFEVEAFAGTFSIDGGGEDFTAPSSSARAAHWSASIPVCSRPLSVKASHEPLACFPASMATTMVEDPEASGGFADQFGIMNGGGIDGDFVGTG
jgi:hypothetical protein